METEDLTHIEWHDFDWINWKSNGQGIVTSQMALDYFGLSPFWDATCNNAILKMQTQYNDLRETDEALKRMVGIEFTVVHEDVANRVFVIEKRNRKGPSDNEVTPLARYYIINANIYQAPSLYSVIANRMMTSLYHVNSAFHDAQQMVQFHPAKGYTWKTKNSESEQKSATSGIVKGKGSAPSLLRAQETTEFRGWINQAIMNSAVKMQQRKVPQASSQKLADGGSISRTATPPATAIVPSVSGAAGPSGTTKNDDSASKRKKEVPQPMPPVAKKKKKSIGGK